MSLLTGIAGPPPQVTSGPSVVAPNVRNEVAPSLMGMASWQLSLTTRSHSSGMPFPLKSGLVPLAPSQSSGTPLALQSAGSHSSGVPFPLQSGLVPPATSHSSGTSLQLQSELVPPAISRESKTPLPLQSNPNAGQERE